MTYYGKQYSWVNEKVIDGITYQVYRCDTNPKKCLLLTDGEVTDSNYDIKEWSK